MAFIQGHLRRLALSGLVLAGLAGAFVQPAFAQAVVVQGNTRVDADTIRSYFTGTSEAQVNQGYKDLVATGLFSDVHVSRQGGRVVVAVHENNLINRVAFEGNSKVKTEQLAAEIQSKSRGPYAPTIVQADVQRIQDVYRRSGRADAGVTARTVDLPNGRVDVVFTVDEGSKTGVKSINFVGNQAFSAYRLRNLMQTTEMNLFSFFKSTDVYDPDRISADEELIRRFYLKNGYADFRIVGSDARYDAEAKGYVITVTVDEGAPYTISSVNVESHLPDVSSDQLKRAVRLSTGDTYNGDLVEKSVEALTREVAKSGYAFASARPRGDRDPLSHTIALGFVVEEGPRVYIERINVRGNTRTRDYVIRREFELGEGDAYNRVLVDRAERRLNSLGFFKKVKVTNEPGSSPDRVVVNVDVEDQPTGSFGISGGYSTTDGLIAELSVSESNFLGRGQYVRTSVSAGQHGRGVDFSFTEPYFLGHRVAAGFDLFSKQQDNTQYTAYSTWTTGGTLRLGLPITDEFTFGTRYSLYNTRITIPNTTSQPYNDCTSPIAGFTPGSPGYVNPNGGSAADATYNCMTNGEASLAIKQAQGNTLSSLVGYSLTYATLDNPRDPTQGLKLDFRQDVAGLGGDSKFVRSTTDLRYYHPVFEDIVGFVRLQGGNEFTYGTGQFRLADNFNLGPSLVRGFAPGGIGPRDISNPLNTSSNSLGGTNYVGGTTEVQFPIFGMPKELGLKGAIFADAGTLWGYKGATNFSQYVTGLAVPDSQCTYYTSATGTPPAHYTNTTHGTCIQVQDSKKLRSSVGVSLLWASPLGPIRFDYAFVLSSAPGDQKQAFRFSGGTSF